MLTISMIYLLTLLLTIQPRKDPDEWISAAADWDPD